MRLKKEQIQKISERIFHDLKEKKLILIKTGESAVLERIYQAILGDMLAEDKLDNEVKTIMDRFRAQISSGSMNEQDVFHKIKKQLAKERKIVL